MRSADSPGPWPRLAALLLALVIITAAPATAGAATPTSAQRSAAAFSDIAAPGNATFGIAAAPEVNPQRFRALALNRDALAAVLAGASATAPLEISLPAPLGGMRRFAIRRSAVMEPALAAAHPEIATFSGDGIDDPGSTVHLDLTPLGLHASVRGPAGAWYLDPYYRADQSVYASYRGADLLADPHGGLRERDGAPSAGATPGTVTAAAAGALVKLRTYRLALVSDPAYADYFGAANVTAAKVVLINRVNQIYEDDLAIHLSLVANNDLLNLDTAARMSGPNGPCGAAPCYTTADAEFCDVGTLYHTRTVIGQLIGASNYDIGHIAMGVNGGGVAELGVVGDDYKALGCTGVPDPVGDLFAVDYVAHEMGHQFNGDHTFNGIDGFCEGNGGDTVEPGSGSTVMAYAGICATDDLQPHSDPYMSQRSIDEIQGWVGRTPYTIDETQTVSLRGFSGTDSFRLSYKGAQSPVIRRGTNYTPAGIAAAIKAIPGFPAAATVTVSSWDQFVDDPDDRGFAVVFGGALSGVDVTPLSLTSPVGVTGFVGETAQGGPIRNGGTATTTSNHAPVVDAGPPRTIPTRTPFALTGSASDADGDPLAYLWEQNDDGSGAKLVSNSKPNGPLFRVFGTAAQVLGDDTLQSPSPGENVAGPDPTRVFPDLAQVVAGDTNAATGACPAPTPDPPEPQPIVDCYSEFLPTAAYANALHMRLTVRDTHAGAGGVTHDDTTLTLAKAAGPFRVTSQAVGASLRAGSAQTVTWSVARTNLAPISTASVKITLSTDGGRTFPRVLLGSTPNDGSQVVTLPMLAAAHARIKVEAIGNVYFDVNHASFAIAPATTYVAVVGSDAPAGYWRLGEASGTTLTDSSGHANNGTYLGGVTLGQAGALVGDANRAARFDGIDDTGRVPDAASLDVGGAFTVEAWIKRSSAAVSTELFNKGAGGLQLAVLSAGSGNQVFLRKAGVSTIARSQDGVPADGRYHHVVATMNGAASARIYIDAVDSTVQLGPTLTVANTAFPLTFGSAGGAPTTLDELALYGRALTAGEVEEHFVAAGAS